MFVSLEEGSSWSHGIYGNYKLAFAIKVGVGMCVRWRVEKKENDKDGYAGEKKGENWRNFQSAHGSRSP